MIAIELEEMSEISSSEVRTRLRELWDGISELGADLHSLSYRLHSSTLERWGLAAGIKSFCEEFSDLQEITVELVHENVPDEIPSSTALCLFRIVQEGLRNVKRHSGANRASVRLELFGDDLQLTISDRGRGFDPHTKSMDGAIGIRSMEERLRLLGGKIKIRSRPMQGTTVTASLPFRVELPLAI
jgi:signal transduction histidine kinase